MNAPEQPSPSPKAAAETLASTPDLQKKMEGLKEGMGTLLQSIAKLFEELGKGNFWKTLMDAFAKKKDAAPALSNADQEDVKLVMRNYSGHTEQDGSAVSTGQEITNLENDPALALLPSVKREYVSDDLVAGFLPEAERGKSASSAFARAQLRVMVARNLYLRNVPAGSITQAMVQAECRKVLDQRNALNGITVFKGRNVVLIAEDEKWTEQTLPPDWNRGLIGKDRFATDTFRGAVKGQSGRDPDLIRKNESEGEEQVRGRILNALKTSPVPTTFHFDGHGYQNKTLFYGMDATMLADALKERYKGNSQSFTGHNRDILVFETCYNSDLIRDVFAKLPADLPRPIIVGSSEYGQAGFTTNPEYGGALSDQVFRMKDGGTATLGDVFTNEFNAQNNTNPVIYMEDEQGNVMQVAEDEKTLPNVEGMA